jgi:hypothetical protein
MIKGGYGFISLVMLVGFAQCAVAKTNWGHRLGGGYGTANIDLVENSLRALTASLVGLPGGRPSQMESDFHYLEFDVQETADGQLVILHDKRALDRMLPDDAVNHRAYLEILADPVVARRVGREQPRVKDLMIHHLTLAQVQSLRLASGQGESPPTLEEVLQLCHRYGLRKPMAAEVKRLTTDGGRHKFIQLLQSFREYQLAHQTVIFDKDSEEYGLVAISAFPAAFDDSFGVNGSFERSHWCGEITAAGLSVVQNGFFSGRLCEQESAFHSIGPRIGQPAQAGRVFRP